MLGIRKLNKEIWAEWCTLLAIATMIILPLFCIMDGISGIPVFVISWLFSILIFFVESENRSFSNKGRPVFSTIAGRKEIKLLLYLFISIVMTCVAIYSGIFLYFGSVWFIGIAGVLYYFAPEEEEPKKKEPDQKEKD